MSTDPELKPPWLGEAENFAAFKRAIREELDKKPAGSEWVVKIEVKKAGNPIHEYRVVLQPA